MEIEVTAESKRLPNGKWIAEVRFSDADGTPRLFKSPVVDMEEDADALAYGAAQDVVRQIQESDPDVEVTRETWNGHNIGRA